MTGAKLAAVIMNNEWPDDDAEFLYWDYSLGNFIATNFTMSDYFVPVCTKAEFEEAKYE